MDGSYALIAVAIAALNAVLVCAAKRGKPTSDADGVTTVFRHGAILRGVSWFATLLIPPLFTLLAYLGMPPEDRFVAAFVGIYLLFFLIGASMLWETLRYSITVSDSGLDCRSAWRSRRFLKWSQVRQITCKPQAVFFVIHATDDWTIQVSFWLPGIERFFEYCERHLPIWALREARPAYERLERTFPDSSAVRGEPGSES